ncbi:Uncharacterized conserved protein, Alpha-E superfamily [Allopseudospirillum japonicum]|uniref:Uncharacterized conserved protein, Alpha-E superfamily n=1 Tax=Allopseudospirillum japonicum TaxID=64971 RepID=A0A1H6TST2_9GAMM|nr:alpha-E domain-containing protein [Allopseudospirillum japonicum]SEI83129.1 Uncharacterized conserved protein, Alpha-E superfamily [Allopseudospirillum japonicum]
MLSRVAENIYWMGRYAERAESSARLVKSTYDMLLDLPRQMPVSWGSLYEVFGCVPLENTQIQTTTPMHSAWSETGVMFSLIGDPQHPSSICASIAAARANARNSRDMLPQTSWETLNACYHYTRDQRLLLETRQGRIRYCEQIQYQCERFIGILMNALERDYSYFFFRLGQMIERADMVTRLIDAKASLALTLKHNLDTDQKQRQALSFATYEAFFWLNALEALGASQSFRRLSPHAVDQERVLHFLLEESRQPRTLMYALQEIKSLLPALPHAHILSPHLHELTQSTHQAAQAQLEEVTQAMDDLQSKLGELHDAMRHCFFVAHAA